MQNPSNPEEFEVLSMKLASPEMIREWSYGWVKKPKTINYRTFKPEEDGVLCAKIFGPIKDWECLCGKYKGIEYVGMICDTCDVELIQSKSRIERFGHIELMAPISHIWFLKSKPHIIGALLEMTTQQLEKVIYFQNYIVVNPGKSPLRKCTLITEEEYRGYISKFGDKLEAGIGAEAVKKLLKNINLEILMKDLRKKIRTKNSLAVNKELIKRLRIVEAFKKSGNKPDWMIMDAIPVLPPDFRPEVPINRGRFFSSDLNHLYCRVININNRIRRLIEVNAPSVIIRHEKRMLQIAVDALFDNCRGSGVQAYAKGQYKSLSDVLASALLAYRRKISMPNESVKRFDLGIYFSKVKRGRSHMTPDEILIKENSGEVIPEKDEFPEFDDCLVEESVDYLELKLAALSTSLAIDISDNSYNFEKLLSGVEDILSSKITEIITARENANLINNEKKKLVDQYAPVDIETLIPDIHIKHGNFYCVKEQFPDIRPPSTQFDTLTDSFKYQLTVIPGIGESTEQKLKANGFNTIWDLLYDSRYALHVKKLLELLENKDYPSIKKWLSNRTILKSHASWFIFSCFNGARNFLFLEIELPGPFILAGLAYFESDSLVMEQYLARDIDDEQAILDHIYNMGKGKSIFSSKGTMFFNFIRGRMKQNYKCDFVDPAYSHFDLSYLSKKLSIKNLTQHNFSALEREIQKSNLASDSNRDILIALYHEYLRTKKSGLLKPLAETNRSEILTTVRNFLILFNKVIIQEN